MDNQTQLDLLQYRIEYDADIFGEPTKYFEYSNGENLIYTQSKSPKVNDKTYLYIDEEMVENAIIESIGLNGEITVNEVTYISTEKELQIKETYIRVLKRLLEDSKYVGLSLRYPYKDYSEIELPSKYKNWQLRCCEEIYKGIGNVGIKSYSENGLSWTRDSGYISYELRGEIEPMVGVIAIEEEEENA